jgi:hypothetical protein
MKVVETRGVLVAKHMFPCNGLAMLARNKERTQAAFDRRHSCNNEIKMPRADSWTTLQVGIEAREGIMLSLVCCG